MDLREYLHRLSFVLKIPFQREERFYKDIHDVVVKIINEINFVRSKIDISF